MFFLQIILHQNGKNVEKTVKPHESMMTAKPPQPLSLSTCEDPSNHGTFGYSNLNNMQTSLI